MLLDSPFHSDTPAGQTVGVVGQGQTVEGVCGKRTRSPDEHTPSCGAGDGTLELARKRRAESADDECVGAMLVPGNDASTMLLGHVGVSGELRTLSDPLSGSTAPPIAPALGTSETLPPPPQPQQEVMPTRKVKRVRHAKGCDCGKKASAEFLAEAELLTASMPTQGPASHLQAWRDRRCLFVEKHCIDESGNYRFCVAFILSKIKINKDTLASYRKRKAALLVPALDSLPVAAALKRIQQVAQVGMGLCFRTHVLALLRVVKNSS
jgi:hypothetical protein